MLIGTPNFQLFVLQNTTICDTTGHTPVYLQFERDLRILCNAVHDFKSVVENDNLVTEITSFLQRFTNITEDMREKMETKQNQQKKQCRPKGWLVGWVFNVRLEPRSIFGKNIAVGSKIIRTLQQFL